MDLFICYIFNIAFYYAISFSLCNALSVVVNYEMAATGLKGQECNDCNQ